MQLSLSLYRSSRGTDTFCTLPNCQCESLIIPAKLHVGGNNRRLPMSTLIDPSLNALTVCTHSVKRVSSLSHANGGRGGGLPFSFDRKPSASPSRRSVAHAARSSTRLKWPPASL
jgi:hypothetical protein